MGRATVTGALDAAVADCVSGASRVVLVEGPTGCGKSTLLDVTDERARAGGALVLTAVAAPAEQDVPLGVLGQLAHGEPALAPLSRPTPSPPYATEAMRAFCDALLRYAGGRPLVLCVDDVHHADADSLRYLAFLARYARSAPVLLIATVSPYTEPEHTHFTTELTRLPHFRRLRLGLLTEPEAAALPASAPAGTAADAHRVTGGNPLLLRALAEEETADPGLPEGPAPGGPFAHAVTACLHRTGPVATALARAAAVLGDQADAPRLARLAGLSPAGTRRPLAALGAAGLLDGTRPRHEAVRRAVLDELAPAHRGALHRRAAEVLHTDGCRASQVAGHLAAAAAEGHEEPAAARGHWTAEVLCEAAEELLARDTPGPGDAREATGLLELALRHAPGEDRRTTVGLRLAELAARDDPAGAERRLTALRAELPAERPGTGHDGHRRAVAALLLAQGRPADAADLYGDGVAAPCVSPVDTMADTPPDACEQVLRATGLTDATLAPLTQAVRSLLCAGRPDRALTWSRALEEAADRGHAPGWSAVFASLHAEALLRLGDVPGAHTRARTALDALPGWGGAAPYTLRAILLRTDVLAGRRTEASRYAVLRPAEEVLHSLHGLAWLRAHGRYLLAVGQPHAALSGFLEAGRRAAALGADRPALLPWRTDAAEALLRLGEPDRAGVLASDQLALPDGRLPWVRGLALRCQALGDEPARRAATLGQAVEALRRSADRVETARAMADLGRAHQADGQGAAGAAMLRSAWNLAKETGATGLCAEILPDAPPPATRTAAPAPAPSRAAATGAAPAKLSNSEQRVATLAAQGLTNREISAKLFLTVSTVEQHLTRVYRKLQINSRGDLPLDLSRPEHAFR